MISRYTLRHVLFTLMLLMLLLPDSSRAQTNSWIPITGNNTWNSGANWSDGVPLSDAATILQFTNIAGGANYWSTNDIATNPFLLNQMVFSNDNPGGGTITIRGTNSLSFTNNGIIFPSITQDGIGPVVISNNLVLGANTTFGGIGGGLVNANGAISGSGQLIKDGTNILILTRANTYTGGTKVVSGMLKAGNATAFGLGGRTNEVLSGGTIDINGQIPSNYFYVITGTGVDGKGALINTGAGQVNATRRLALAGDASVGGPGRFDVRNTPAMLDLRGFTLTKAGSAQFSVVNGSISNGSIIVESGMFAIESGTICTGNTGTISVKGGATLMLYNNSVNALTRPVVLTNGATILGYTGVNARDDGPIILTGNATNSVASAANSLTLSGNISESGGSYGFTKIGPGTLILSGTNTFTGAISLNAGALQIGTNTTIGAILGDIDNKSVVTFRRSDTYAYNGLISGTGAVTQLGSGNLVFSNANTFSGGMNLQSGTMSMGHNNSLGIGPIKYYTVTNQSADGTALTISNAWAQLQGNPTFAGTGSLTFTSTNPVTLGANRTIYVSSSSATVSLSQAFTGGNSLSKNGSGTLVLSGTNSHTGGTILNIGTMIVSTNTALGRGTFTINTNTTFLVNPLPLDITNALAFNGSPFNYGGTNNIFFSCAKPASLGRNCTMSVTNASTIVTMASALGGN